MLGPRSMAVLAWNLLKEATVFITSTIVWSQVKQQGGNTGMSLAVCSDIKGGSEIKGGNVKGASLISRPSRISIQLSRAFLEHLVL